MLFSKANARIEIVQKMEKDLIQQSEGIGLISQVHYISVQKVKMKKNESLNL